jgi:hypothetical protein
VTAGSEASTNEERELRMELMRADIAAKKADAALKTQQMRWEPWKVVMTAMAAGSGLTLALLALLKWIEGSL